MAIPVAAPTGKAPAGDKSQPANRRDSAGFVPFAALLAALEAVPHQAKHSPPGQAAALSQGTASLLSALPTPKVSPDAGKTGTANTAGHADQAGRLPASRPDGKGTSTHGVYVSAEAGRATAQLALAGNPVRLAEAEAAAPMRGQALAEQAKASAKETAATPAGTIARLPVAPITQSTLNAATQTILKERLSVSRSLNASEPPTIVKERFPVGQSLNPAPTPGALSPSRERLFAMTYRAVAPSSTPSRHLAPASTRRDGGASSAGSASGVTSGARAAIAAGPAPAPDILPQVFTGITAQLPSVPVGGRVAVRLTLNPPSLGSVGVTIVRSAQGISLLIVAQSEAAGGVLASGAEDLRRRIGAAEGGSTVDVAITVERPGGADNAHGKEA